MRALHPQFLIVSAMSLVLAAGCQTPAHRTQPQAASVAGNRSPFLERGEFPERFLLGIQSVLDKHRFVLPWIAIRGEDSSFWFVAERTESERRFDRAYVHVTADGSPTVSITPHAFIISGWGILGKRFVDLDPEARVIAGEIAKKLKDPAHG